MRERESLKTGKQYLFLQRFFHFLVRLHFRIVKNQPDSYTYKYLVLCTCSIWTQYNWECNEKNKHFPELVAFLALMILILFRGPVPRHNAAVLMRTHVHTYTVECFTAVTPEERTPNPALPISG